MNVSAVAKRSTLDDHVYGGPVPKILRGLFPAGSHGIFSPIGTSFGGQLTLLRQPNAGF